MKTPDKKIIQYIQSITADKTKKVVIVPHVNPDGDAIGSSMALYYFFASSNIANVVAPSSFPKFLEWIPQSDIVLDFHDDKVKANELISQADLIILSDHNAANRSGDLEDLIRESSAKKLMIDHHPDPSYPIDFMISCTDVSSTSELVYNFISAIETEKMNKDIASSIYVGIMTDTGNFMHNVHKDTFYIVSQLIEQEINRDYIYNQVFNNYSQDRMRLMGFTLSERMEVLPEINTVLLYLNKKDLEKFNYQNGDTEGFVNMPLAIEGINSSVLLMEKDGIVKMSFRSKGDIAINHIAKTYFGGGGHKNAAGGKETELSVEDTLKKLKTILLQNAELLS